MVALNFQFHKIYSHSQKFLGTIIARRKKEESLIPIQRNFYGKIPVVVIYSKNRISHYKDHVAMPPMGTILCGPEEEMTDHPIAYYAERAAEGIGLIIIEIVAVEYLLVKP